MQHKKKSWLLSAWQCSLKNFCRSSYNCHPEQRAKKNRFISILWFSQIVYALPRSRLWSCRLQFGIWWASMISI
jgi:hypothetical protein